MIIIILVSPIFMLNKGIKLELELTSKCKIIFETYIHTFVMHKHYK